MSPRLIAILTFLVLLMIFTIQNSQTIELNFFFWHFPIPLAILYFVVFILGLLTGLLLNKIYRPKAKS
ncbi:MAG: hypothetical protein A3G93_02030 [Nitrospinae bacterium RIFCSPLOWO2_12_FULL_45_22]|nr:MAG: hypothetical protein A3G93_02030 [Nitrospinae bacterium RIFCSPLOWO2_12_FULL_45_22]